jgi:hypothetical protein
MWHGISTGNGRAGRPNKHIGPGTTHATQQLERVCYETTAVSDVPPTAGYLAPFCSEWICGNGSLDELNEPFADSIIEVVGGTGGLWMQNHFPNNGLIQST